MEPIDVITTVLNGREFIDDYISGWSQQTYQNFNIIVVDDGSSDQGVQYLEAHWPFPDRLTVVRTQGVGRSAALNLAIQSATSDILAIADIDDVPLPNRLMETARYFERNPGMSMVSFYSFSEEKSMRAAQPLSVVGVSLLARSLLGMPASFPTFGFRKSKFTEAFDEELTAGVDCDWIHRNIVAGCGDGHMMPMEQVYYRVHDTQISSKKAGLQKTVATKAVWDSHSRLLGELSEDDKHQALVFSRWKPIKSGAELPAIFAYCSRLAGGTRGAELYDSDDVRAFIWMVYEELRGQLLERDGRNWRKTALELKKERVGKSVVNTETGETECPPRHYGLLGWRWILVPFVRPFVRRLGTERDLEFYNRDPAGFMMTLTRPGHVRIRRWLFPQ